MNQLAIPGLTPALLKTYLQFQVKNTFPTLVVAPPGVGKSEIIESVGVDVKQRLILTHPVVSEPTDYKGLPFASKDVNGLDVAKFLPFGDLQELITTQKPIIFFIDDFGQAPASVQAALMQLILAGRINGHEINKKLVTFIAATNGRADKAGVSGLLEPVKSRFSIVELEVSVEDWVTWAHANNMPVELIGFVRHRPELLHKFEPTKDISNSPCPRNIAFIGMQQSAGLPKELELNAFKGRCGEAFAMEYKGFLDLYRAMPNLDQIVLSPKTAKVSNEPCIQYALAGALARRVNEQNIDNVITYLDRLPGEIGVVFMKDAAEINSKKPEDQNVTFTRAWSKYSSEKGNLI